MSNTNTGGPAFPVSHDMALVAGLQNAYGMTLRDYFAAKAMQAIIANSDQTSIAFDEVGGWIGNYSYEVADAMLKAREA